MKVIYPGSFNPITKAHLKISEIASRYGEVIYVPVSDKYEKSSLNTNAEDRFNMIKLVSDNEVSRIEIDADHQLKTYETLNLLKKEYNDELLLLIGGDNLKELYWWYRIEDLLKEYKVLVISRDESLYEVINNDELLKKYQDSFIIIDNVKIDISSKMVRERLKNNKDINELLDKKVIDYIKERNLYE